MRRDPVRDDLMAPPEAGLPEGAVLVRPSLWMGLVGVLQILSVLAFLFVPVLLGLVFGAVGGPRDAGDHPQIRRIEQIEAFAEFAPLLIAVFLPAVRIFFTRYAFGPDDLRVKRQVLERNEQRVEWKKITALRYRRTLFDRLFGLERIDVVAYGRRGTTLRLVGLRRRSGFHQFVAQKMRAHASVEALFAND